MYKYSLCVISLYALTHRSGDKMAAILLKTSQMYFPVWKKVEFWYKFLWNITLFLSTINNNPALVQIMAWRCRGDKLLSEPHKCVFRPRRVNKLQTEENWIWFNNLCLGSIAHRSLNSEMADILQTVLSYAFHWTLGRRMKHRESVYVRPQTGWRRIGNAHPSALHAS